MPFVVQTKASLSDGSGMSASLKKMRTAPAVLTLTLRPRVAVQLGWEAGAEIAVLLGDGAERGLLRLRPEDGGSAKLQHKVAGGGGKRGGPYFSLNLGHVPAFPDRSEPKRWVKFEAVEDGWVEVVLPGWADAPRPTPVAAPVNPAVALAVARSAGTDVTARMMGDPPPQRSALAQRPDEPATKGAARRQAEALEAPHFSAAEAAAIEREVGADDFLARVMGCFGLTKTEGRYLVTLLDGRLATRERLLSICHDDSEEIDLKNVDVYVHKLRAKLNTRLVQIETIRAQGYRMDAVAIARVRRLVDEAGEAKVA